MKIKMSYRRILLQEATAGRAVNYHSIIGRSESVPMTIASDPWELGNGYIVVKVKGKAGGVSLEALSTREKDD